MGITSQHPDYTENKPLQDKVVYSAKGQEAIKDAGETYLPKTSGMEKNDSTGKQYNAYKSRARFYGMTGLTLNGLMGIAFQKSPIGELDEVVTNNGLTTLELSREVARAVSTTARSILVVDSPKDGGKAYITRYKYSALINWRVDSNGKLELAVFQEEATKESEDKYETETETVYREYELIEGKAFVTLKDKKENVLEDTVEIKLKNSELPIVTIGSIDLSPQIDPIPLLAVTECDISAYQLSADYKHGLFMGAQPTPWVKTTNENWEKIKKAGMGSSALWNLGEGESEAGLLEYGGAGIASLKIAIEDELKQAETHGVRLTQTTGGVEAAESVHMRAAAQHATIYTMLDSISKGIRKALELRAELIGKPIKEEFSMNTEFTGGDAEAIMVTALNNTINSTNLPKSVLQKYVKERGLTDLTPEEQDKEIETGMPQV